MATRIQTRFDRYSFLPGEKLIFTDTQIAFLKNEQATYAEHLLNLDFDPQNPLTFAQQQAVNRGVVEFIDYLIQVHEANLTPGDNNESDR